MDTELRAALDDIEAQRIRLLGNVRTLTPAQQEYRPPDGGWCPLEVIQHLVLTEEAFLAYGRRKRDAAVEETTLASKAMALAVNLVMASPIRVKAPVPAVVPQEVLPYPPLVKRWEEARSGLCGLLESIPPARLDKALFKHPVAGKITALEGLRFVKAHVDHHVAQLGRIRAAAGYPAPRPEQPGA